MNKTSIADVFNSKSFDEKLEMATLLREIVTLNGFTKADIKAIFDWLYDNAVEFEEVTE